MRALWLLLLLVPHLAFADGGAILTRQTINDLDVTVFAAPLPLRAGPVDVSVLVQDAKTTKPLLDAQVEIAWSPSDSSSPAWMPPCCSMDQSTDRIPATRAHSQNKLIYSSLVPIKSSGPSELIIRVKSGDREALLSTDVTVGPPRSPALAYWPWLAFPPFAIAGFAVHQHLSRRRR